MAIINLYGNEVVDRPLRKKKRKLYSLVYPKPYDTIYPEHHPLNTTIFPEMYGKINLKKSIQKVKDKLKKASPLQKALAIAVLGPIAPTLTTSIAAKKTVDYAASKNPKLKAKIEQFKKLPIGKKIALAAGGALVAPLIPAVAAVAIPTAAAALPVAATIKGAKVATAKIKAAKARKAEQIKQQIIEEKPELTATIPASARTEAGLEQAVIETVEKPIAEEKKTTTGNVLKWIAPLAAIPFFFGEM